MIIALSGKIGSGKDTVGNIIQYLTHCKDDNTTYEEWQSLLHTKMCDWKIKKFAYKLKQIVSILTGCTIEDLESQEFKDKELPKEWNREFKHINWIHKNELIKFAELANMTFEDYIIHNKIEKGDEDTYRLTSMDTIETYTYRKILQLVGTECMRNIIHTDCWCNALFSEYKSFDITVEPISEELKEKYRKNGKTAPSLQQYSHEPKLLNWIITDVRFPNELKAIKDRNGITIRINRYPKTIIINNQNMIFDKGSSTHLKELENQSPKHPSETALDNAQFDYTINNNGTIEELIEKVKEILIKEKII